MRNSEIVMKLSADYDFVRLDRSRKRGGVACFIKHSVAYSYKPNMCLNTEIIFTEIYLPKSKPFLVVILYGLPDKIDIANRIDQIFSQSIQYIRNPILLPPRGLQYKFAL